MSNQERLIADDQSRSAKNPSFAETQESRGGNGDSGKIDDNQIRIRLLVKTAKVGLWDWDLLTNDVYFSPEWKQQLGYADQELPNRFEEWEQRLHPTDREPTLAAVRDYRDGKRPNYDVEFRMRHKDGSWRWIFAQADFARDAAGRLVRMMGCHIDITDHKKIEEASHLLSKPFTVAELTASIQSLISRR